jgi:hypothetical protein
MRFGLICVIVITGLSLATRTAQADTTVFARAGAWQAFGGTTTDGTRVCGVSTSWPDNRYFGLKFFKGDNTFTIQLGSPKWSIDNGAKQSIVMQIDQNANWHGTATGMHFGDQTAGLQFEIARRQLAQFIEQFRHGETLYLSFPNTNASDWTATLEGTNAVTTSFMNCINAI